MSCPLRTGLSNVPIDTALPHRVKWLSRLTSWHWLAKYYWMIQYFLYYYQAKVWNCPARARFPGANPFWGHVMIIIILTLPSKGQLISKGHFWVSSKTCSCCPVHYFRMILQYFGMKIYYDFELRKKKTCFGPIQNLFT